MGVIATSDLAFLCLLSTNYHIPSKKHRVGKNLEKLFEMREWVGEGGRIKGKKGEKN